jgi:hypothetical protein
MKSCGGPESTPCLSINKAEDKLPGTSIDPETVVTDIDNYLHIDVTVLDFSALQTAFTTECFTHPDWSASDARTQAKNDASGN